MKLPLRYGAVIIHRHVNEQVVDLAFHVDPPVAAQDFAPAQIDSDVTETDVLDRTPERRCVSRGVRLRRMKTSRFHVEHVRKLLAEFRYLDRTKPGKAKSDASTPEEPVPNPREKSVALTVFGKELLCVAPTKPAGKNTRIATMTLPRSGQRKPARVLYPRGIEEPRVDKDSRQWLIICSAVNSSSAAMPGYSTAYRYSTLQGAGNVEAMLYLITTKGYVWRFAWRQ